MASMTGDARAASMPSSDEPPAARRFRPSAEQLTTCPIARDSSLREALTDDVCADSRRDPTRHLHVERVELAVAQRLGVPTHRSPDLDRLEANHAEHRMRLAAPRKLRDARFELIGFLDDRVERTIRAQEKGALAFGLRLGDEEVDDVIPHRPVVAVDRKELVVPRSSKEPELEDVDARRHEVSTLATPEHGSFGPRIDQMAWNLRLRDSPQDLVPADVGMGCLRLHGERRA